MFYLMTDWLNCWLKFMKIFCFIFKGGLRPDKATSWQNSLKTFLPFTKCQCPTWMWRKDRVRNSEISAGWNGILIKIPKFKKLPKKVPNLREDWFTHLPRHVICISLFLINWRPDKTGTIINSTLIFVYFNRNNIFLHELIEIFKIFFKFICSKPLMAAI